MRLLLGIILGVLITIAAAYLSDNSQTSADQRMVNWEIVDKRWSGAVANLRQLWTNLRRDNTASEAK